MRRIRSNHAPCWEIKDVCETVKWHWGNIDISNLSFYVLLQLLLRLVFEVTIKPCLWVFPSFESMLNTITIQTPLIVWCLQSTGVSKGKYLLGCFSCTRKKMVAVPSTLAKFILWHEHMYVAWAYVYCKCNLVDVTCWTRNWIVCFYEVWLTWRFLDYLNFNWRSLKPSSQCSQDFWFEEQMGDKWSEFGL